MMAKKNEIGGIVHTYQKYDPMSFPSPTQPPPDLVSPAMEHMLMFGSMRELSEEELARAIRIDPSQIKGLGPSIDMLIAMLLERKRKILEKYETDTVLKRSDEAFRSQYRKQTPPKELIDRYDQAFREQQIYDFERLWYSLDNERSSFARHLLQSISRLADKYQVEELASRYEFTGREPMTVEQALEIKEELEKIDELLKQLEDAMENAQIALVDLEALAEFVEPGDVSKLQEMQQLVENYVREMAERQGLDNQSGKIGLTPHAYKVFQGKLLERIFSDLQESKTGRHTGPIVGEGAVELTQTKEYEFGDSLTHLDIPQSFVNALVRRPGEKPIRLQMDDLVVHRTRNNPKCATVVIMDMSGSMRYDGQYVNVKRMALGLDGLIRSEYPGDFLQFIEMYSFAKLRPRGEIINLLPKPVTIHDPFVQLAFDMSRDEVSEHMIHPHFTNIQHALRLARQNLALQDTPNRQIVLITDGLPTAHFDESMLYLLYPPHPLTEAATMREGMMCKRDGITINMFLVPSWSQSEEDIRFAYRLAETTSGRVFFTAGKDLDRFVLWDYLSMKREIIS